MEKEGGMRVKKGKGIIKAHKISLGSQVFGSFGGFKLAERGYKFIISRGLGSITTSFLLRLALKHGNKNK